MNGEESSLCLTFQGGEVWLSVCFLKATMLRLSLPLLPFLSRANTAHLAARLDYLESPAGAVSSWLLPEPKWWIWSCVTPGKWEVQDVLLLMAGCCSAVFQDGVLPGGGDDLHQASPGGDIWLAASTLLWCNPGFSPSSCSFFTLHLWFWNKYTCKLLNFIP